MDFRSGGRSCRRCEETTSCLGGATWSLRGGASGAEPQGRSLRVPRLTPRLLGCDIITVEYALMIYLHIPGSEKLILELPLVIGTIPLSGVGSLTSSVSSQAGYLSSWSSFPLAPPPSYGNIHRDLEVDGPLTPLLQDYDEEDDDGGLFMTSAELCYRPPPAYTEVDQDTVNPHQVVQVF